jgi:TolB protein
MPSLALRLTLLSAALLGLLAAEARASTTGKITFASNRDGNFEIYAVDPVGTNPTRLTTNADLDTEPVFSPDGSKIAFASYRDNSYEIYVMNADGSQQTNLTNHPAGDTSPAFSPDGSRLAFASARDGGESDIYVMQAEGSGQTRLTDDPAPDTDPVFSPDGSKIAFKSYRDEAGYYDVYVMNADGSGQTNLTASPGIDADPAFSPDGSKIAFTSIRDGNFEIYVMNSDGSGQTRLTDNPGEADYQPAFSPGGAKIVFTSYEATGDPLMSVMNADGSGRTRLTTQWAEQPNWGVSQGEEDQDRDDDAVPDNSDNCPDTANADQADRDQDGIGDVCDPTPLPDNEAPSVTIARPVEGASYAQGATVIAQYSCTDTGGSGLTSCVGSIADGAALDTSRAGTKTFTVTARDEAANVTTKTVQFTVTATCRNVLTELAARLRTVTPLLAGIPGVGLKLAELTAALAAKLDLFGRRLCVGELPTDDVARACRQIRDQYDRLWWFQWVPGVVDVERQLRAAYAELGCGRL